MIEMDCACVQRHHQIPTEVIEVSDHAIEKVGDILKDYRRIFMVADENTPPPCPTRRASARY